MRLKNLLKTTLKVLIFLAVIISVIASTYFIERAVYPVKYEKEVISASLNNGIDKTVVFAVIKVESGFNERAVSDKGAVGLMQITPKTAEYIAALKGISDYDLFLPKTNIDFGVFYIKYLLNKFGNIKTALIAYNAGEGNVLSWLKDEKYSFDGVTLKAVPFKESGEYIAKIEKTIKKYRKLYPYLLDK